MPALEFYRGVLGLLCVCFGYMAGRSAALVRKSVHKISRLYAWILRTVICGVVLVFRHPIDNVALAVWGLCLAVAAVGYMAVIRQKPAEDLTHEIFPE